jgi:superfamily II DNA or RNA helicase
MLRTAIRSLSRPLPRLRAPSLGPRHTHWPTRETTRTTSLILRAGVTTEAQAEIDAETSFPEAARKLRLRDYQLDCIKSVTHALKNGHKRVGISLATGSGKTVGSLPGTL